MMKISDVILERIHKNHVLDAYVKSVVARIDSHISSNSMVFFPEYTDHDITHFEAVLETAIDLATEKSLELMSDADLVILTTSVMLHDVGMHITKDGFETLIAHNGPLKPVEGFLDQPWHELWLSFLAEARRFDARKLEDLFGPHYKPVTRFPSFSEPWSEFDYLLVGEFLRRYHPRLAHEIALQGMPSKDGTTIQFCNHSSEQEHFLSDIGGLVARSHGMALRQTFSYLDKKYNNKIEIRSAHPVYLMTLLRVADYLQIQSARAPSARTDVAKFKSPVSTREWSVHQCVTDITNLTDPEAIDIIAKPNNIETFLRLKDWITDLQKELDLSWAVLGELYGLQSHSGLHKLGLRIRRLRSNIDAVSDFAKTVNYIPEKISFSAAGSDLLKLLVGPLYANEASVGLRELIQNATDAVKELDSLVNQKLIDRPEPRPDISADVQVDFVTSTPNKRGWPHPIKEITITDRGVGMTPEILKNYFLRAGASFRSSNAWKESFAKSDGSSEIQRSGRFGVGALAAFLLGDEIKVETRHYSEKNENGLKFSASIDTSSINISREPCPIGTRIIIPIPERLQDKIGRLIPYIINNGVNIQFGIGNYFGRYPSLLYTIDGNKLSSDPNCLLPTQNTAFEDPWNYFESSNFEVNWTYANNVVDLAVNQIRIAGARSYRQDRAANAGVKLHSNIFAEPSISIGDNSGSFELNLQRNSYAALELPFGDDLLREITDEFIFECLWHMQNSSEKHFPTYAGLAQIYNDEPRWIDCSDGIILNEQSFLKNYNPNFCVTRYGGNSDNNFLSEIVSSLPPKSIYFHDVSQDINERRFGMKGLLLGILRGEALTFIRKTTTRRTVLIPSTFVEIIVSDMKPGRDALKTFQGLKKDKIPEWLIDSTDEINEPKKVFEWRKGMKKDEKDLCIVSLHTLSCGDYELEDNKDKIIFERWMELLGQPHLPRSKSEIAKLTQGMVRTLGDKYSVFERRKKTKNKEKQAS